jgi:hypothetical protein
LSFSIIIQINRFQVNWNKLLFINYLFQNMSHAFMALLCPIFFPMVRTT